MEPMIRQWRDRGPRRPPRILTIERDAKCPWMHDDQIMRAGAPKQDVGNKIHVRLAIGDKLTRAWQANDHESGKCPAP